MPEGQETIGINPQETQNENPVSAIHRVAKEIKTSLETQPPSAKVLIPEDASKKIDWLATQASLENNQGVRLNSLHEVKKITEEVSMLPLLRDQSRPVSLSEATDTAIQNNHVAERLLRIPALFVDDADPLISHEAMNDFGNMVFNLSALPGFKLGEELRQEVVAKMTAVAEKTKSDGIRIEAISLLTQLGAVPKR